MKYIKTFENHKKDITEEFAEELLPVLQKLKEKGPFTEKDFESYMKERGASLHTIDLTMSYLVSKGFDFDREIEDDEPVDFELKNVIY